MIVRRPKILVQATKIAPPSAWRWIIPALHGFAVGAVIGLAGAWALVEYLA